MPARLTDLGEESLLEKQQARGGAGGGAPPGTPLPSGMRYREGRRARSSHRATEEGAGMNMRAEEFGTQN